MATRSVLALLSLTALLVACKPSDEKGGTADTAPAPAARDTGGMAGMPGMGGGMIEGMQAHMRMMDGVSPDSMRAMLPMHRQMVANMISQMNSEMRGMNMQGDAPWQATVDSLRNDLTRMPDLSARELGDMMPAHRARVTRLMEMHRSMMGGMKR